MLREKESFYGEPNPRGILLGTGMIQVEQDTLPVIENSFSGD